LKRSDSRKKKEGHLSTGKEVPSSHSDEKKGSSHPWGKRAYSLLKKKIVFEHGAKREKKGRAGKMLRVSPQKMRKRAYNRAVRRKKDYKEG